MSDFVADVSPGLGIQIVNRPVRVFNADIISHLRGEVLTFLATSPLGHASPPDFQYGSRTGAYAAVARTGTALAVDGWAFICALDQDLGAGQDGKAWFVSDACKVFVDGAVTVGQPLGVHGTNNVTALQSTPGTQSRIAGISHTATGGVALCTASFFGMIGTGKGGP